MTVAATVAHSGTSATYAARAARPAIREILYASDLSQASDSAFCHARMLAEEFDAHLTLYHDIEVAADAVSTDWGTEHEVWRRMAKAAREHLERRMDRSDAAFDVVIERKESARQALAELIEDLRPDLAVMATHGRGALAHLFHGSVTERVIELGRTPVLCVREPDHGVALPYRRLLLPTDLSQASRRAFPMAALLARRFGADVLAVHVARPPALGSLSGVSYKVESELVDEAQVLRFLQPELRGVNVSVRTPEGSASNRIVELARVEHADLVVMATRGHDSMADRLLGSHADHVVRNAPCPVLVVG